MKKNYVFAILGGLAVLNILAWWQVFTLADSGLKVTFFDVGQGDAAFIETPENQQILIDGGPNAIILEKLGKEMPFWDRTIDLVVLTHPEQDHMAGLLEVLKRYKVENILWTGIVRETAEYREWQKLIQEEVANIYIAENGMRISGDSSSTKGSFDFLVLFPFNSMAGQEIKNTNDSSIVMRLSFGETSFLFSGDASKSVESQLLDRDEQLLDIGVLKVGHHGSKTSSSQEFIKAVSPAIAVISVGKDNKFGHPHQEVLDNLSGIKIFRTDMDGDIKMTSDGTNYIVKN